MNMKKLLACSLIAVTAFSMLAQADARPMGGGRSFGRQSQNVSRQMPSQAPRQFATPAPAAPVQAPGMAPRPASPLRGIVGGALLGLGMGALLSHFGMGGAIGGMFSSILMIGLLLAAVFFIVNMFRRKSSGNTDSYSNGAQNYGSTAGVSDIAARQQLQQSQAAPQTQPQLSSAPVPWGVPADFDKDGFLRHAKMNFIRLQAAWDKADINDIREFTTPEMYAELKMQIQERGATPDFTDVVSIDAELMGIETGANDYLASVKFQGMIKSAPNAAAEPFAEVWNMAKPVSGGGWVLAGIQQIS